MAVEYTVGERVRLTGTFKDPSGALVDPATATVHVKYREPDGVIVTKTFPADAEVVKDSTGVYHVDLLADQVGVWEYRWYTDDPGNESAAERSFFVPNSKFV